MEIKVNEIAISYSGNLKTNQLPKITSSQNAAELLYGQWNKNNIELHETFKIMLLNNANKVKGIYEVSTGGITGTLVDLRIIFAVVLKSLTTAVILAHNHPSGTLRPSEPDKRLTQKIKKAGELFDIKVLDHLILTPDGNYFSFADEGML
ncbi:MULTISPECIES: JAB domain-containing protein [Flavobacteriaceae]|jgi:DNA repair protein RadC|uniref:JAB domain-containing protein n=2 Tax=Flavobacteriaceae TaxID=49546 RepID=A0ABU3E1Z1_9FLAO|nr:MULTISPECIES: JAB domain-containing protein [Flavobacteriaceae]MDT0689923.1 JAB domain-containing protein [Salegentibacter sp. F188]NJW52722.1 JAB domain-containing protein [Salinimicrobium oceani]